MLDKWNRELVRPKDAVTDCDCYYCSGDYGGFTHDYIQYKLREQPERILRTYGLWNTCGYSYNHPLKETGGCGAVPAQYHYWRDTIYGRLMDSSLEGSFCSSCYKVEEPKILEYNAPHPLVIEVEVLSQ